MNNRTLACKILKNAARCKKCETVIESRHVHDFVTCSCKSIFTDGGLTYIRRGGLLDAIEDLSIFEEDP